MIQQFYTFNSGGYSFKAPSLSTYTVRVDTTTLMPVSIMCPFVGGSRVVSLSAADSVEPYESFGMQCTSVDYAVLDMHGTRFRQGDTSRVDISAGNYALLTYNVNCGSGVSGTVTTMFSGTVHYVSPAPGAIIPSGISGSTLTYNINDLDSLQPGSLGIILRTDTTAVVGTDVCIQTIISPSVPDINPMNDTLSQCFVIVNSWDPNHKSVYPATLTPDGGWLTYTIDFQNTGTDTAYTVVLRDTLSPYVDASSFQYIASDHKAVIQLMGNAIALTFPRIDLVDSTTDSALSTGWIQYKVKALPNLPISTQVKNTAYIYFDYNAAVVTNTTINTVDTATAPSGIRKISNSDPIHLYPNPNKGTFTLTTVNSHQPTNSYTITDMLGNIVGQGLITSDTEQIDIKEATEGIYTLTVKGATPIKFVIMR